MLWLCANDGVDDEDFTLAAPFTTYPLYTHIAQFTSAALRYIQCIDFMDAHCQIRHQHA